VQQSLDQFFAQWFDTAYPPAAAPTARNSPTGLTGQASTTPTDGAAERFAVPSGRRHWRLGEGVAAADFAWRSKNAPTEVAAQATWLPADAALVASCSPRLAHSLPIHPSIRASHPALARLADA